MIHASYKKSPNILVLVSHSLSELDVLWPIFSAIRSETDVPIEIIISVRKIYRQYQHSAFYNYCSKILNVKVSFHLLPNKFDPGFRFFLQNKFGYPLIKIFFSALSTAQYARCFKKLRSASLLLHEFSNQTLSTFVLYRTQQKFATPIFVYDHGHAIRLAEPLNKKLRDVDNVTLLSFHPHNYQTFFNHGFKHQKVIGYPKFFPTWKKVVQDYSSVNGITAPNRMHVVIFSRHVHPYYMDKDTYIFLLTSAVQSVRNTLGSTQIIIKPHPREDVDLIQDIVRQQGFTGIGISNEHPAVLAQNALFAISFWGSVILDPLSFGIPAIEYYIEAKRFREQEPEGSSYSNLGIDSVDNPTDLECFIRRVVDGGYTIPKIVHELSKAIYLDRIVEVVDPDAELVNTSETRGYT